MISERVAGQLMTSATLHGQACCTAVGYSPAQKTFKRHLLVGPRKRVRLRSLNSEVERTMLRKLLLIVAAIAGVAVAFAPTGAFARGGRGGGGRGYYRGGGRGYGRGRGVGLGGGLG